MSGLTASNLPVVHGVGAVSCTRNARRGQYSIDTLMLLLQVGGRRGTLSLQLSRHAKEERRKRKLQRAPKTTIGRVFSSSHTTPGLSSAAVLHNNTQQAQPQPPSIAQAFTPSREAQPTRGTQSVSSGSECKQFASGGHVHSSRKDISADHDRAQ
jgi:hypothetical protein